MSAPRSAIAVIARLEFRAAVRLKWTRFFSAAFALLAVGVAYSSGALGEMGGADGFARTTVALVPLTIVLVPLSALLLGVSGQTGEPGAEAFFFAQPVTRFEVLFGKWLGQAAALATAVAAGFGAGGLFLAASVGTGGLPRFLLFVLVAVILAAVFLAIAALISAGVARRATAMGVAAFAWFVFVLLEDAIALSAAGWLNGRTGARALFLSVFGNPAGLARVLMLSLSGTPHVLGAAGDAWNIFLGGAVAAAGAAFGALAVWVALSFGLSRWFIARRDL
jgi:Cu-processing system permease protein